MADATIRVVLTAATLLTGRTVAQDSLECTFFSRPNLIMVGGHETHTPVLPLVLDYTTLDLTTNEACHALTWGVATKEGSDENSSRKKICFGIGPEAINERQDIKATFANIAGDGTSAEITKSVAAISAWDDRATALKLAEDCRMRSNQPKAEGIDGLDIRYMRRLPLRVATPTSTPGTH